MPKTPEQDHGARETRERMPTKRQLQQPIGENSSGEGSWISGTGDEEGDPLRVAAAERAARAVAPGRERE